MPFSLLEQTKATLDCYLLFQLLFPENPDCRTKAGLGWILAAGRHYWPTIGSLNPRRILTPSPGQKAPFEGKTPFDATFAMTQHGARQDLPPSRYGHRINPNWLMQYFFHADANSNAISSSCIAEPCSCSVPLLLIGSHQCCSPMLHTASHTARVGGSCSSVYHPLCI